MNAAAPRPAAAFDLAQLRADQQRLAQRYLEFLRVPALSLGLYRLAAGEADPQQPHAEDEAYVVLSGRGRLRVGEIEHDVAPGTVVHVAARVPHAFHSLVEDLLVLVVFAPAEGTADAHAG